MAKRIGERLIEAGLLSSGTVEEALRHQKITGERLGDCLVDLGLVQEGVLLRFLAAEYQTRFVTAEKLAKAKIPADVLDRVPVRMAEAQDFVPIAYDAERKILSIVMAEPQKQDLVNEIALVTAMNEVYPMIGMRRAIRAAIKKHYYGDPTAFEALEQGAAPLSSRPAASSSAPSPDTNSRLGPAPTDGPRRGGTSAGGKTSAPANPTQMREALGAMRGNVTENDYLETVAILVGLLEMPRKDFRGHSAHVARQASLIARRMGVPPREAGHTAIAAHLHDLGKREDKHFTLPTLSMQADARAEAKRALRAPIKLFEAVHLPGGVNTILAQLYEAFDGSGLPQGVKGEDIAVGARIIAAVDAFFDLTRNPFNALGRVLPKQEALGWLRERAGQLFDAVVVDALDAMQSGELLRQRLESDGRQLFVADPDEATRTDLMDCLGRQGLVVQAVLKLDAVIDSVLSGEADTVVVGLAYGVDDIVALAQFIRARPESASLPVLVVGDPTDAASRERLVQAGVTGFVPLPLAPEAAATIIATSYLERIRFGGPGHVVRGSFDELAPAEVARLLGGSRKSGRLRVRNGPQEGAIVFERGRVVFATFGEKKGDVAVAALFAQQRAEFQYDPEALLGDMPNVDCDLEVLAVQLASGPATTA